MRYSITGRSRNVQLSTYGIWTQEEYDQLFGGEMPDTDVIVGYVVDQSLPTSTEVKGSRYGYDDFTESQPIEWEEYVPSTQ